MNRNRLCNPGFLWLPARFHAISNDLAYFIRKNRSFANYLAR